MMPRQAVRHTCKALAWAAMLFCASSTWAADSADTTNAATYQTDMANAAEIIFHLSRFDYAANFVQKPDYGRQVLTGYMKQLDPEHLFFSAEDATEILQHADGVLAAMQGRDTTVAEDVATKHIDRVKKRMGYALNLINKGFKFDGQDSIMIKASSAQDFMPEEALNAAWAKIIKSDWLNLKLEGLADSQIKDRLTSRYAHFEDALVKADQSFALIRYVKACVAAGDPAGGYWNALHGEKADDAYALQSTLALDDDADGPLIRSDGGDVGSRLKARDRLVGISVGGGGITYLDGASAATATSVLKALPEDVDVKLYIRRAGTLPGAPIVEVPLNLAAVPAQTRISMQWLAPPGAAHGERVAVVTMPVMYGFYRQPSDGATSKERADVDLRNALTQARAQGAVAVVLDLRGDTGGYITMVNKVAQVFLENRTPWRTQTKQNITSPSADDEASTPWDGPLSVLVNGHTAEGGEMLAAALQDYGRALIIGDKTAGDGNIDTLIDLNRFVKAGRTATSDLGSLKMTVGGVFRADGESIAGHGVTPDVRVSQPAASDWWFKEDAFPPIAPIAVTTFTAFQSADAEVARNHQHGNDPSGSQDTDSSSRSEDVLSLNYAQRKAERGGHASKATVAEDDTTLKEAVNIAYEQSRTTGAAASASVSTAASPGP
jgi:carboxyl-terminal processing protease